jgi:hypothetical protein
VPNLVRYVEVDAQTKVKETYTAYRDSNGTPVKHGLSVMYYPSGAKLGETNYKHGKPHGRSTVYSEDGRLVTVGYYRDGEPWEGVLPIGEFDWVFHKGKPVRLWKGDEERERTTP